MLILDSKRRFQTKCVLAGIFCIAGASLIGCSHSGKRDTASTRVRKECAANQISSLVIDGTAVKSTGDFCEESREALPPSIAKVLTQVGGLNQKIAAGLGVKASDLFKDGVKLAIQGTPMGPLLSEFKEEESKVIITVFPEWNGEDLNDGVYIHEVGHQISLVANSALPASLLELTSNRLMMETLADTLAMQLSGKIISEARDIPRCIQKFRVVRSNQSYDYPREFFDYSYGIRSILSCCKQAESANDPDAQLSAVCAAVKSQLEGQELPKFDRETKFNAEDYVRSYLDFDPHQIGIPINSFFRRLSKDAGVDVLSNLMAAIRKIDREKNAQSLTCEVPAMKAQFHDESQRVYSMETVFQEFRKQLKPDQQARYDQLFKQHALDKAVVMIRGVVKNAAVERVRSGWGSKLGFMTNGPCFDASNGSYNPSKPGCSVVCEIR